MLVTGKQHNDSTFVYIVFSLFRPALLDPAAAGGSGLIIHGTGIIGLKGLLSTKTWDTSARDRSRDSTSGSWLE